MFSNLLKEYVHLILTEKIHSVGKKFKFEEFKYLKSHKDILNYAKEHLTLLDEGSSRIVYILSGTKVLKIALSDAGVAQNEQEYKISIDPISKDVVTKIFDHAHDFIWITSELVKPLESKEEFANLLNLKPSKKHKLKNYDNIPNALSNIRVFIDLIGNNKLKSIEKYYEGNTTVIKFAYNLKTIIDKYHLLFSDLMVPWQWGRAPDGRLVLLDSGASSEIYNKFYDKY